MKKRFELKVYYDGDHDPDLDAEIKDLAKPGIWWAQGYDFQANLRDIAFDYRSESERDAAVNRMISAEKSLSMSWS